MHAYYSPLSVDATAAVGMQTKLVASIARAWQFNLESSFVLARGLDLCDVIGDRELKLIGAKLNLNLKIGNIIGQRLLPLLLRLKLMVMSKQLQSSRRRQEEQPASDWPLEQVARQMSRRCLRLLRRLRYDDDDARKFTLRQVRRRSPQNTQIQRS